MNPSGITAALTDFSEGHEKVMELPCGGLYNLFQNHTDPNGGWTTLAMVTFPWAQKLSTLKAITQGCYSCQLQILISWELEPKKGPKEQVIPHVVLTDEMKRRHKLSPVDLHYNHCHKDCYIILALSKNQIWVVCYLGGEDNLTEESTCPNVLLSSSKIWCLQPA